MTRKCRYHAGIPTASRLVGNNREPGSTVSLLSDFIARAKIDQMAKDLADQFKKRLPLERISDRKRIAVEFEVTLGHARGLTRANNFGTYGKSRLANSFQWSLIESGYERNTAMELGRELASRLAERDTKVATK